MASLGTEWIEARADHGYGVPYRVKSEVTVDRDGDFRYTIPVDLVKCAQRLSMKSEHRGFSVTQLRTSGYGMPRAVWGD